MLLFLAGVFIKLRIVADVKYCIFIYFLLVCILQKFYCFLSVVAVKKSLKSLQ